MDHSELLDLLNATADEVAETLRRLDDWAPAGTRPGQYRSDLNADAVAVGRLTGAGCGVLSEESGWHRRDAGVVVVVDPLDGSTNASRRIPWYATSLCALDAEGPVVAVVLNLATGQRFTAVRGEGASVDGRRLQAGGPASVGHAFVGLSGYPSRSLGWKQYRALGAVALDLCAVAGGTLDGYVDCSRDAHGSWDYLGGMLVCQEAGAAVVDAEGRDLLALEHDDRRTPVAAATPALLAELLEARRGLDRP